MESHLSEDRSVALMDDGVPDIMNLTRPFLLELNNFELDGSNVSSVISPYQMFGRITLFLRRQVGHFMDFIISSAEHWPALFLIRKT